MVPDLAAAMVLIDTHIFNESTLGALMAEARDEGHLQTAEEPAIGRFGDDHEVSFVRDDLIECLEIGLRKRFGKIFAVSPELIVGEQAHDCPDILPPRRTD